MATDDQVHQAAIRGPRSSVGPAIIGALVGGAATFIVMHFVFPPPPPPAPAPVASAPTPCTAAAPEPAPVPVKEPPKRGNRLASLLGRIDPATPAPERHATQEVDREALGRFIRDKLSSIRVCYDRELKLSPSLKGKIVVRFDVTPAGRVGNGMIESDTMKDDAVSRCILTLMRGWSLPFHPAENTTVSFPFVFQPGG